MILSASIPNVFNAGGKTVGEELIQTHAPAFTIRAETRHATKPSVAAVYSVPSLINSCTAAKGKQPLGKASSIGPNFICAALSVDNRLNPCKGRMRFCN